MEVRTALAIAIVFAIVVLTLFVNPLVGVFVNNSLIAEDESIDFVAGTGMTITGIADPANDVIRVTFNSSATSTATSTGDITDVGPGCTTGACLTDSATTTGTNIFIWEGTTVDGSQITFTVPADPATSSVFDFDSITDHEWSPITSDFTVGDEDEGQISLGTLTVGKANDVVSTTVTDGMAMFFNNATTTPEDISFMFLGPAGVPRFVLAVEGADLATYNPRSMLIGPAASFANVDENVLCSTNFSNIDCDTGGSGADLGVQDDVEIGGDLFLSFDCTGNTNGGSLTVATSTGIVTCSDDDTTATPGGADTEIQFNNAGVLDGDPEFIWNAASTSVELLDNTALVFGTGNNSSILFNATDTIWDLQAVDTGGLMLALGDSFPSPDLEAVHIWKGDAGAIAASSTSALVLESDTNITLSFLSPNNMTVGLVVGDPEDNNDGRLLYGHSTPDWQFYIGGTRRLRYSAGAFTFQEATTISATTGGLTLTAGSGGQVLAISGFVGVDLSNTLSVRDNIMYRLGTTGDVVFILNSAGLAADEELANVIEGTSNHQGTATNSMVWSNITDDGDMIGLVSDGGNSKEFLLADADVAHLYLGHGMTDLTLKPIGDVTLTPGADIQIGPDIFIEHDVNSGLVASTTQSQGASPLTTEINEISVVGTTDDVVTLPAAATGRRVLIINNATNTVQVFPALGDNLGAGIDISEQLEANEVAEVVAYNNTNWRVSASTETRHAEMFDSNNTDVFGINAQNNDHVYHTSGLTAGDLAGFTFDAGSVGTSTAIASIADGGGGEIAVTTSAAHGLAVDDIISISNTGDANYDVIFVVNTITSGTIFEVTATFGATATGTMDQAATLTANIGSAGQYLVQWSASATSATNNETFDFAIHIGAVHQASTNTRRKFGIAGDVGAMSGVSIIDVANSDKIAFQIVNIDSAADITIRNFTMVLVRL